MIDINELRRLAQHHDGVTSMAPIKPATIVELLDRLELAESRQAIYKKAFEISENTARDLTEKVIPNIRGQLEAAEKDIALKERIIDSLGSELNAVANERDALQAKVEAMEQQEPVGKFIQHPSNGIWEQDGYGDNPDARPLYALPGAKGEQK